MAFSPRENASRIPASAGGACKGKNLFTLYICMPKVSRRTERVHVVVEQVHVGSGWRRTSGRSRALEAEFCVCDGKRRTENSGALLL